MRSLLTVVISMGVLILVGVGVLVFGIVTKMDGDTTPTELPALVLPAGSKVEHMTGDSKSIILYVTNKDGDKLYYVHPKKGVRGVMPVQK